MLTYSILRTQYGELTNSTTTNHLDRGINIINNLQRRIVTSEDWPFMQRDAAVATTVASTQDYDLPSDYDKAVSVYVTSGTTQYVLNEISSWKEWELLNQTPTFTSSFPVYYFIQNNGNIRNKQVSIWPVPSSTGDTINVVYRRRIKDLTVADYSTGTITSIANGAAAVVGSGTTWTDKMEGSFLRITDSFTDNTGDGVWYEVETVGSATSITLSTTYQGPTIAAGTAAYILGQTPIIPENYQPMLLHFAAYLYWNLQNNGASRADRFRQEYEDMFNQMVADQLSKADDIVVEPVLRDYIFNPNLFIQI